MSLNDLKIGTLLRLGLGLILLFVFTLGLLAWRETDLLWLQTKMLYENPLQVRRAVGKLEFDVERMSRDTRELLLARDDQETATALESLALLKGDVEQQLATLDERYLGPRSDVVALREEYLKWNAERDETIRMLREGKAAEAESRIRQGGVQDRKAALVRGSLRKIDTFAVGKSEQLYRDAATLHENLTRQLAVIVAAVLLLTLFIFWFLLKRIKDPLRQLGAAVEQFRQGQSDVRCGYASTNEFGVLAAGFNAMADTVATQMRIAEQAAQLTGVMLRETEPRSFCRELLKELIGHTGSQIGAIYLLNSQKSEFEHFESIGLGAGGRVSFSAALREGEFGAALATGRLQRVGEIPADTHFSFATVGGEFRPREIITIPLLADHTIGAVLSLASVRGFSQSAVELLTGVQGILSARMTGILAFREIQELAARLDQKNRELDAQRRELAVQASELTAQNTELEMQKRQVEEANRLKSAFLSTMSHELRTPLNSVIALTGVLDRRLGGKIPAEEHGYLEVIGRNGRHLLALINDVLDLSRIESGREDVSLREFSLPALVGDIVAMLEPQAREKGIALESRVGDELPAIVSDPGKCRHILQNLIGNAVKFTEAGSVTVSARRAGDDLLVEVRDTGIGIAADQLPRIFEEFRQADDSASRKYGGTGLGLAIARGYAGLLHGGITVESAPGRGSTFTFRLPLTLSPPGVGAASVPAPGDSAGAAAARHGAAAGHGQIILLVEDSEPAVIQVTDILVGQGYRVRVARNGHEALEQVGLAVPDAMILDLMMPQVDGFQVLAAIRGAERTAGLPVLILTARHVTGEELSFLKGNNIHQLIQKGDVGKGELLAAVASMVAPAKGGSIVSEPRRDPAPRGGPRPGKPLVLVVEDNPDNLRTARALLSRDYDLIEAKDGRAGVELARRHRPDLILMDIAMPVMDGVQALREIRGDEALRHLPVIAVTASAMVGDRETILAHGFDGYLSKPIDAALLKQTLRDALD